VNVTLVVNLLLMSFENVDRYYYHLCWELVYVF